MANAKVAAPLPRLKKHYDDVVRPKLIEEFGYKNPMEVPTIEKIVLNMGVGEATRRHEEGRQSAAADLALIAGQKPVITKARKAIATFKVRENMPIGCKVTLRKTRMYEFLDRLVTIALPRVRDFRGLNPKSFDGRGNYAMGIKEHLIFPEINYDKVESVWGMDIIVCTTAKTDDEARALLRASTSRSGSKSPALKRGHRRDQMAKKSSIEKNKRRAKLVKQYRGPSRRAFSRSRTTRSKSMEERFEARLKLAELPRNSSPTRIRNRCEITGRPRAYYRKLKMSRIALRELGSQGPDPGPREVELVRRRDHGMNDPVGDMLTRIRNAQMRRKTKVSTPGSRLRARVLDVLAVRRLHPRLLAPPSTAMAVRSSRSS